MEASWWERLTEGETGSCSDGQGHILWIFNPIFYWWVELCSLPAIYLGPNYGGGDEDNGDLLQKVPCMLCYTECPQPCSRSLPTHASTGDSQRLTGKSTPALLTMTKPLTVWITISCGTFWEMGIPDHLTCLLRNLYVGHEATVRTGHETADWFQIGKEVRQGCILAHYLFNFYAEYIMRNAGLDEAQAGIKIAGRIYQ